MAVLETDLQMTLSSLLSPPTPVSTIDYCSDVLVDEHPRHPELQYLKLKERSMHRAPKDHEVPSYFLIIEVATG